MAISRRENRKLWMMLQLGINDGNLRADIDGPTSQKRIEEKLRTFGKSGEKDIRELRAWRDAGCLV